MSVMKSAPRDGTPILVRDEVLGYVVVQWTDHQEWDTGFSSEIDGAVIAANDPEKWWPLPEYEKKTEDGT